MRKSADSDSAPADVLAAEEFGVPAPDPVLRHEALRLPPDLIGSEPHEVLAAEEFAMPAPEERRPALSRRQRQNQAALRMALSLAPSLALWLWRRGSRRRG